MEQTDRKCLDGNPKFGRSELETNQLDVGSSGCSVSFPSIRFQEINCELFLPVLRIL